MRKKPMLAYPVSDKPINYEDKIFMQPKLDGVRCLIQSEDVEYHEPNTGKLIKAQAVKAYSRTGKEWKNIHHILEQLKPFFQKFPNVILDGELYNHDLKDDFETIISLVRRQKPDDLDMLESADLVQFHCYDIIDEELPFQQRIEFVTEALMLLGDSIYTVDTMLVPTESQAQVNHARNLDSGYEGSILRTNDTYQCKRSHSLRKFKDFSDAEATIIDFVEGKGKREGTLGKFIMRDADGIEFGCPPGKGYNYKNLKDLLHRAQWYVDHKATATFTYFERTKAGSYRHPLFKCIRDYE